MVESFLLTLVGMYMFHGQVSCGNLVQILEIARRHLGQGGPRRMQYTLPPLIFSTLKVEVRAC
jgi:hypothetical protein